MIRNTRTKRGFKVFLFALIVVALLSGNLTSSQPVRAAPSKACTTYTNIRAVDEGGGSWNDRKYYLYVYGTTRGNGQTYYWYVSSQNGAVIATWMFTGWSAVGLADNNRALKIGVSTWWAYSNPNWKNMKYKYVLC